MRVDLEVSKHPSLHLLTVPMTRETIYSLKNKNIKIKVNVCIISKRKKRGRGYESSSSVLKILSETNTIIKKSKIIKSSYWLVWYQLEGTGQLTGPWQKTANNFHHNSNKRWKYIQKWFSNGMLPSYNERQKPFIHSEKKIQITSKNK